MKKSFILFVAFLLALAGCSRNQEIDIQENGLSLFARTESPADTKTVVESGVHVYWEPGDEIAVFMGEKSAKFTTDITASSATATFKGTFGDTTWPEELDLWAVYPFSEDAVFDGETITTTLPSEQIAREGSFGKDMNLSIAHSTSNTLQFYNVGGGIRFSVTEEGIKKVMFEGLSGEIISGKVKIGLENGLPVVKEVTGGSPFITLLPPTGKETFEKNTWYYIVAIPGSFEGGYKLRFYKDSDYARKVSEKAVTIKRSIFGNIEKADEGIEYEATTTHFPETLDEWKESEQIALDVAKSINSVVSAFTTSDNYGVYIQDIIEHIRLIDDVISVIETDDSMGMMIQLRDSSWVNYLFEIPGFIDIDEEDNLTNQISKQEVFSSKANRSTPNRTTPNNKKALIVAPYQSRGCNGSLSSGFISVDYDYVEEQLSSVGFSVTPLKNKSFTISDLTGDKLKQYGLIVFSTHGGNAISSDGQYQTILDTGISFKEEEDIPQRESLARVIYYDEDGKNGHYYLTASWLKGTISDQTAGAYGNTIVIMSACLSYRLSDLADYLSEHGASAYCGNYNVSGIILNKPLVNSMVHSLCCGLDVMRAAEFSERDPLYSDYLLHDFVTSIHPFSFHSRIRDGVSEAFLVNPYPKNLSRIVNKGYVDFSWEQNKTTGNYSYDVYVDDKKLKSTYDNSYSIYTDITGKHDWYVVANLSLYGEVIASYRTDGESFTVEEEPQYATPEAIDLGLPSGIKWASFNLGASKPEERGYYYRWGETQPVNILNFQNYKWSDDYWAESLTKYCDNPDYGLNGFVDNKIVLEPEDDAAYVNLGGKWRMPTKAELIELIEKCNWEPKTRGGMAGWEVSNEKNVSIFIPSTGFIDYDELRYEDEGDYWSSSLYSSYPSFAVSWALYSTPLYAQESFIRRTAAIPIRPVYGDKAITTNGDIEGTEDDPWN